MLVNGHPSSVDRTKTFLFPHGALPSRPSCSPLAPPPAPARKGAFAQSVLWYRRPPLPSSLTPSLSGSQMHFPAGCAFHVRRRPPSSLIHFGQGHALPHLALTRCSLPPPRWEHLCIRKRHKMITALLRRRVKISHRSKLSSLWVKVGLVQESAILPSCPACPIDIGVSSIVSPVRPSVDNRCGGNHVRPPFRA